MIRLFIIPFQSALFRFYRKLYFEDGYRLHVVSEIVKESYPNKSLMMKTRRALSRLHHNYDVPGVRSELRPLGTSGIFTTML